MATLTKIHHPLPLPPPRSSSSNHPSALIRPAVCRMPRAYSLAPATDETIEFRPVNRREPAGAPGKPGLSHLLRALWLLPLPRQVGGGGGGGGESDTPARNEEIKWPVSAGLVVAVAALARSIRAFSKKSKRSPGDPRANLVSLSLLAHPPLDV